MYNSSFRTRLFVIVLLLLLLSPLAVHAAGLGKLTLNSALGQPLQAEIDIVSVNDDELSSLKVELASRDAFTQAGIRYESFFSTFNVSIEPRDTGEPYVIITSPQSINEPFLNILVELSWASGRLLREYTVLLDPIEYDRPAPVAPTVRSAPAVIETTADAPAQTPQVDEEASKLSEPAPAAVAPRSDTYGPVARGDTLSGIVSQITPEGVNLNQMLVAMYRANREAFIDNNMNLLRVGALLRIPDSSEIMEIDEAEANAEVKIQVADWRSYREKLVEAANEAQPSEVLSQADSGQITTSVDNDGATFNGEPEEVLRLSSGDAQGEDSDTSMMDRLRMTEEDAIAHTLALQEANERVAMLEKQVEDLQQLLELKQPDLAQAQYQAEVISEIDTKSEPDPLEIITSSPELILDEEIEFTPEQEVSEYSDSFMDETIQDPIVVPDPIIEEVIPEPVTSPTPLPIEEKVSYMDLIMENIEYVVGALVALLGILFFIKRRQEKSEEEDDMDDMDFGDTPDSMRNKMAAVAAAETASSMDSDSVSSDSNEATELESTVEEAQEADFEKDENFFPEEKDYDAHANKNMDLAVESPQETADDLNDEFIPEHEIELDLSDASSSQDEGIEFEEVTQDIEQVEPAGEIDLDLAEEATSEDANVAQSEEEHEIEFDLGDLNDGETKSEQEETDSELMDADTLIEQAAEIEPVGTAEPAESLEPELAESASDEDASSDDQIDLVATKLAESPKDLKDVAEALDYDLNFDLDDEVKSSDTTESADNSSQTQESDPNNIDFEHDTSALNLSDDNASVEIEEPITEVDEVEIDNKISDGDVDVNEQPPELDLADINLDMENEQVTEEAKPVEERIEQPEIVENAPEIQETLEVNETSEPLEAPEVAEKSELWHEVETKMDLAKAYQEMDDKEGAREMFEEVMRDGDGQQQEKAKAFLKEL